MYINFKYKKLILFIIKLWANVISVTPSFYVKFFHILFYFHYNIDISYGFFLACSIHSIPTNLIKSKLNQTNLRLSSYYQTSLTLLEMLFDPTRTYEGLSSAMRLWARRAVYVVPSLCAKDEVNRERRPMYVSLFLMVHIQMNKIGMLLTCNQHK